MKLRTNILLSLILFTGSLIWLCIAVRNFIIFPDRYLLRLILSAVLLFIAVLVFNYYMRKVKKGWIASAVNVLLSICMISGVLYLPKVEERMKAIFNDDYNSEEFVINAYVLTTAYKGEHSSVFKDTGHVISSDKIEDYKDALFIKTKSVDQQIQDEFIETIEGIVGKDKLNVVEKDDILSSVGALYSGEAEVLILIDHYVDSLVEIPGYENFEEDTMILYTGTETVEVADVVPVENTGHAKSIFVAGNDTRSDALTYYGRTDVDLIVTYNTETYQVLIVSIPRDFYVENPYYWDQMDKLTHLANNGLDNTMKSLDKLFDINIPYYMSVNFRTFKNIVDALGGIDVENPYYFTTVNGNGGNDLYFPEGTLHLNGEEALSYCRERYNLSNGDYGRNEHQAIVMKALINKMSTSEILANYDELLTALQNQFITNIPTDQIYSLARLMLDKKSEWDIVMYHLGGTAQYNTTISMGDIYLYTVIPFESQLAFIHEQIGMMNRDERIEQLTLPNEDDTTWMWN